MTLGEGGKDNTHSGSDRKFVTCFLIYFKAFCK
jgi:hypothetical protein